MARMSVGMHAPIACGWSSIAIARAFPSAHMDGLDADQDSIARAREHAAAAGLQVRVSFVAGDAGNPALRGGYAPADEVEPLLYAASVLHCLPVGRAEDDSAATGTVMRPSTLLEYAAEAGLPAVEVLSIEHDVWRFYLLRP